ncbi:MAG: phosphoribosylanthranilate isomerase [Acidobacteriaceae bacterium]|jgi:phosphoribosylanthranilate isomerase
MTWLKICCNTTLEDALLAASLGADALGFVFAPSKRQLTPAQAAAITPHLPTHIERVGVFQSHTPQTDAPEIAAAAQTAHLTHAQLHGPFSPTLPESLRKLAPNLQLIQTLHWDLAHPNSAPHIATQLTRIASLGHITRVLIDSKLGPSTGGTGVPFDWSAAHQLFTSAPPTLQLIVAGGLTPANVAAAIAQLRPWGVDVCSGVESAPGRKDPALVAKFIANARGAQTP